MVDGTFYKNGIKSCCGKYDNSGKLFDYDNEVGLIEGIKFFNNEEKY